MILTALGVSPFSRKDLLMSLGENVFLSRTNSKVFVTVNITIGQVSVTNMKQADLGNVMDKLIESAL